MDRRLEELESMITQLAWNSKMKTLMSMNGSLKDNIYKVRDTWRDLSSYSVSNQFIDNFFIYLKKYDIILSPYISYIRLPLFYGQLFKYGDLTYDQFHKEILTKYHYKEFMPAVPVSMNSTQCSMIAYAHSIPFEFTSGNAEDISGNIIFFIDEKEVHKLLSGLNIKDGGWAYVADQKGRIITSIAGSRDVMQLVNTSLDQPHGCLEQTISGERMVVSYTTSSDNGWIYVAALPSRVVLAKVDYVRKIIIGITLVALLIGVIIAYFLAYHNSKPLKEAITILRELVGSDGSSSGSEYDFLRGSISNLIDNNKALKEAMQSQVSLLKVAFIDRLLKGEFNNPGEMEAVLSQAGLQIKGDRFAVLIARVNGYNGLITKDILNELGIKRVVVKDVLKNTFRERGLLHDIDVDKIALIICYDGGQNMPVVLNYLSDFIKQAGSTLYEQYNIKVTFAIGSLRDSLQEVYQSYDEARQALEYKVPGMEEETILYRPALIESTIYYYPLDLELRLINLIKAGDRDEAEKYLKSLYSENFNRRSLSSEMVWQLLNEVRGTILKVMEQVKIDDSCIYNDLLERIHQTYHHGTADEIFHKMLQICSMICDTINDQKKSHNVQLKERIVEYLSSNYMKPQLCLSMVAANFDLTEAYLSQFFKEQTGENFSSYLERVRMHHAHELLKHTDLPVDDIAQRVGYNSAHAFRRVYKRINGIVPTASREAADTQVTVS